MNNLHLPACQYKRGREVRLQKRDFGHSSLAVMSPIQLLALRLSCHRNPLFWKTEWTEKLAIAATELSVLLLPPRKLIHLGILLTRLWHVLGLPSISAVQCLRTCLPASCTPAKSPLLKDIENCFMIFSTSDARASSIN